MPIRYRSRLKLPVPVPRVGQTMTVHGQRCRITKVYRAGTVDVLSEDGERAWRVTGLGFLNPDSNT